MAAPCMSDRPHLFLTGEKGVGKSTLIQKILGERCAGGFYTVRTSTDKGISLHLITPGEMPNEENFLTFCPPGGDEDAARRFERLGCAALERSGEITVMDELGPAEAAAQAFHAAVLRALDGQRRVLGVLQKGDYPFYRQVAEHPRVRLVEVREDNREELALILPTQF